jgi:hypothetical protein
MAKKPKLGSGTRFKQLKSKLASKGAKNPGALAAYIGRKKFGAAKMGKLAAAGKKRSTPGKGKKASPASDKSTIRVGPIKTQEKLVSPKTKVRKRSAGVQKGSKNPFGNLGKAESKNAGRQMFPNILSKSSKQATLHTGKSLLKSAKKRKK